MSTKLSVTFITELCRLIATGVSIADACYSLGLTPATLDRWMGGEQIVEFTNQLPHTIAELRNALAFQGLNLLRSHKTKKENPLFASTYPILTLPQKKNLVKQWLNLQVKKAVSSQKAIHIGNVSAAGQKSWQASAWFLERRYPEEYALRTKSEIDTKVRIQVVTNTPRPKRLPVNASTKNPKLEQSLLAG